MPTQPINPLHKNLTGKPESKFFEDQRRFFNTHQHLVMPETVPVNGSFEIPAGSQMTVYDEFNVDGNLVLDGSLLILDS